MTDRIAELEAELLDKDQLGRRNAMQAIRFQKALEKIAGCVPNAGDLATQPVGIARDALVAEIGQKEFNDLMASAPERKPMGGFMGLKVRDRK